MRLNAMQVNGLYVDINTPPAPKGDAINKLPPYLPQKAYVVDEYEACPANWMHGSDLASSYFVGLETNRHLWLDFNANWSNNHHVAVVISIQGINPITGQHTKELRLEQYVTNCPVHNIKFGQDRFCEKCKYKWPSQNYLTTTSTPQGMFWIDGFRAEQDVIRGFITTEESIRGVATQMIGEERVWAIGIAFYLSKEQKPRQESILRSSSFAPTYSAPCISEYNMSSGDDISYNTDKLSFFASNASLMSNDEAPPRKKRSSPGGSSCVSRGHIEVQKLEIGAGAKIKQELAHKDPQELSFYQDKPAGLIYVNYCTMADLKTILSAGKRDTTNGGEGFLNGLKTGNPIKT